MDAAQVTAEGGAPIDLAGQSVPRAAHIEGVPVSFYGPDPFPCFACTLRSVAAFHGVQLSRATILYQGTHHFSHAYVSRRGLIGVAPSWRSAGFSIPIDHAARVGGVELKRLSWGPGVTWERHWRELCSWIAAGEPVILCLPNIGILWDGVGLPQPGEEWGSPSLFGHSILAVAFDEDEGTLTCHDSWWYFGNAGADDREFVSYRIADYRAAFEAMPSTTPPFVFGRRVVEHQSTGDLIRMQADILAGTRVHGTFMAPDDPAVVTGHAALDALADDFASSDDSQTIDLIRACSMFFRAPWTFGRNGQASRASWLSGVAAALGSGEVERAAFHLDEAARFTMLASHLAVLYGRESADQRPVKRARLVRALRDAADEERDAERNLRVAATQIDAMSSRSP